MSERIYLYDSTLRDGAQARGVDFTVADKIAIAKALGELGIDYIEGGWPGANPIDDAFFAAPPKLAKQTLTAFGMTRRAGRSAENDPGLQNLLQAETSTICLVGKSWSWQVEHLLGVSREENLRMIAESIRFLAKSGRDVFFDAEHFFDGYHADPDYALDVLKAAHDAGAQWLILCDTNGGSLPERIGETVAKITNHIKGSQLGIHCHNDTGCAVANSLAAVQAGVRHVQGTINGIGERCGNANLITLLPNLMLKYGYKTGVSDEKLTQLMALSQIVDERLGREPDPHAPYVGRAAFAHKGGLHVSAINKDASSYEHIPPQTVGNARDILISDKAGKSNIVNKLNQLALAQEASSDDLETLVTSIKHYEQQGYAYENADASFELLVRRRLEQVPHFFTVESFRVMDERRHNAKGELITISEATVKLNLSKNEALVMEVAEGNGPINALDRAIRKALLAHYPALEHMKLVDYKVRILMPNEATAATAALTRVMVESENTQTGKRWTTIGVSSNVIDASFNALNDAFTYALI